MEAYALSNHSLNSPRRSINVGVGRLKLDIPLVYNVGPEQG